MHYNRWLTDNIKNYIENINPQIKFVFNPYNSFETMSTLFGLSKSYFIEQRRTINAKKVIAKSALNSMRKNFNKKVSKWIKSYPNYSNLIFKAQKDILDFIDVYDKLLNPKPTPRYQMYEHHPNFNRYYFSTINSLEKAYWLGFLFADGYIAIEHKISGDYYRMGIGCSESDKDILLEFCTAIGLNPEYIKTRDVYCAYTNKSYPFSEIRWGDQDFASDLIDLGMQYEYNEYKQRREKVMKMPTLNEIKLMLAFLLGFYDGDGSLSINKNDNSIYPLIKSQNKEFLIQIKKYFQIKNNIKSEMGQKYNYKNDEIIYSKLYNLYLGIDLFRKMLENYRNSLIRKRIPLDRFREYGISPVRHWLMKKLPKEKLEQILKVISPNKIGEILGVKGETISSLAKNVYNIKVPLQGRKNYMNIQYSIRNLGIDSQYYIDFYYWSNFLKKAGKFGD